MKKMAAVMAVFLAVVSFFGAAEVQASSDPLTNYMTNWPQMDGIGEDSGVVIDADSGAILYSLNRDIQRYPASITKIMTCLLTLENANLSDIVTMTETGMAEAYSGSSNVSPDLGEQFTVEQCLYMLMLKSGNDIASQLAEFVGGSVPAFVDMMNARAAALGCTGTHFHNAHGLPDEEHVTTAYDMALIMREALKNEEFRKIIGTQIYKVGPTNTKSESRVYENHFKLILEDSEWYYPDAIGGKTGYTDSAWRTLVGAAERDGRTLVCVVMHGPNANDFGDMQRLFEYGFNNFKKETITGADGTVLGSVTIPSNFSLSDLTAEEKDGRVDYYYEQIFVGSAEKEEAPAVTEAPAAAETPAADASSGSAAEPAESTADPAESIGGSGQASAAENPAVTETPGKNPRSGGLGSVVRILVVVLVMGVILAVLVAYKRYLDRERAKRRIRRRKKKEEEK